MSFQILEAYGSQAEKCLPKNSAKENKSNPPFIANFPNSSQTISLEEIPLPPHSNWKPPVPPRNQQETKDKWRK